MRNVARQRLIAHQKELAPCALCPKMIHPPVLGPPVLSRILQVGQAPGPHEQRIGKPFAWTCVASRIALFGCVSINSQR